MLANETSRFELRDIFKSKTFAWFLMIAAFAYLFFLTYLRAREGLYFDDAYMFVRYAINLINYGTYGWNANEHTYGCTNIPFTFFIALLQVIHLDRLFGLSTMLLLSSLCWAMASLAMMARVIRLLLGKSMGQHPWLIDVYVGTLAFAPVLALNVITGMDTTFSMFFNVLMIYYLLLLNQKQTNNRVVVSAFFSYFIFLVRPDCGLYSFLLPLLMFIESRKSVRLIITYFSLLLLFFTADTIVKKLYFGNPFPLPYFVKKQGYYRGYLGAASWNGIQYSFDFLFNFGLLFIGLLIFRTGKALRRFLVFGIPLAITMVYYLSINQMMGFHARYYLPSMPFFVIGTCYGFSEMKEVHISLRKMLLPLTFGIFLIMLNFGAPVYGDWMKQRAKADAALYPLPHSLREKLPIRFTDYKLVLQAMQTILSSLPENSTIAATENGLLSVQFPRFTILDLSGLQNREIAFHGYGDKILATWRPVLIWLPPNEFTSLRREILLGSYFTEHYDYFPGAMDYGIAILKTSPQHDGIVRDMMSRYY